nr:hypothetical protein [Tanacetum cinerariifolium]
MSSTTAQQAKINLELVPKEKILEIRKCNRRLNPRKIQREPIFQFVLDVVALAPCHSAFLIIADVPEVKPLLGFDQREHSHQPFYLHSDNHRGVRTKDERKHRFHPRPDSLLHLSNEEPVLGYLKFSPKGTKREILRMPIPGRLIMANIRATPYYQEYQENVAKNRGFLAGETRSTQDLPAPRPVKPARKPQSTIQKAPSKPSISSPVTSTQPAPTSVPAK